MVVKRLDPLLKPKAIAVVGASEKYGAGSLVIENLRTLGYEGKIIPINPRYESILGYPCYPSLHDVPSEIEIDCAAIVLGVNQVIPVLEEAGKRGVRGAWAFASGFAETGDEGARLQKELLRVCLEHDIVFCGPNCVGYANLHGKVGTYSAPISPTLKKGGVAAIAQSGSVILVLANSNRGVGFSTLVSSGNEAVLDTTDYMNYFLEDRDTEVIVTFLEAIRRPEAFIQACERAAELKKPVIVVKIGRSGLAQKAALTHTGALTGSDKVHDTLFKKLGVIRVDDLDQLLETAEALVCCRMRLPEGGRVGAITVSGGEIGLIGDLSQDLSISFPPLSEKGYNELRRRLPPYTAVSNPLDGWGSGDLVETYPACLEVLAKEKEIDLIIVSQDSPPGMAEKQVTQYADVARATVRTAAIGKPVVAISHVSGGLDQTIKGILDEGRVPFLQGTRESLVAIHHLVEYSRFLKRKRTIEMPDGKSPQTLPAILESLRGERRVLGDDEAKKILQAYRIAIVKEEFIQSGDEVLNAANRIGYPVALKGLSPRIPHKIEAGLVRLNVRNGEELSAAYAQIQNSAKAFDPKAELEGMLIQEMVPPDAAEILVGTLRDPSFGPVVILGLGGIWVELLADTSLRLPPISLEDALEMISELKGKQLLEGFRGRAVVDMKSLTKVLVQVGRMAVDLKEVLISLDLNPLMVLPGERGTRVIDVVMEVGST
jgi:acyl-CoA synthetase (NDP forming)